jgi:hypothetical protein
MNLHILHRFIAKLNNLYLLETKIKNNKFNI